MVGLVKCGVDWGGWKVVRREGKAGILMRLTAEC